MPVPARAPREHRPEIKYNEKNTFSKDDRSPVRATNNFVKAVLIREYGKEASSVLDIGVGRFGDLCKWNNNKIKEFIGLDVAENQIAEAKRRAHQKAKFDYKLLVADAFAEDTEWPFASNAAFDTISCQFAVHYAFGSKGKVERLAQNISKHLQPGGVFLGTTVDAEALRHLFDHQCAGNVVGNDVFRCESDDRIDRHAALGQAYRFTLTGDDQKKNVIDGIREYVVDRTLFEPILQRHGLKIERWTNFHPFIESTTANPELADLWRRRFSPSRAFTASEWQLVGLYCIFVIRRI